MKYIFSDQEMFEHNTTRPMLSCFEVNVVKFEGKPELLHNYISIYHITTYIL